MALVIFYVPCPDGTQAQKMIGQLLEEKLIACGNVVESQSTYCWEGALCIENEVIAIMKSLTDKSDRLEKTIKEIHPYQTPAILRWEVQCNHEYLEWVRNQLL